MRRPRRPDPVTAASGPPSLGRLFVVEERNRKERLVGWVLRRQRLGRIRRTKRTVGGVVESAHWTRSHDGQVRDAAVLVHVEGHHDMTLHRHGRVGDDPVPFYLRDEVANPGSELYAFGVKLDGRSEGSATSTRILELITLHVALQITKRIAQRATPLRASRS